MSEKIEIAATEIPYYKDFFDLLIITATPTEKAEVHNNLEPIEEETGVIKIQKGKYTYFLGKFGHYNAIHVATGEMGMSGRTASIHTAMSAIDLWEPKVVLMVGIAFGGYPSKVNIGDVLVSDRVVYYGLQRANKDGSITNRGAEGAASSLLLDRFRSVDDWAFTVDIPGKESYTTKQVSGLLLSGETLVDNARLKNSLMRQYPTAIGGEMEGGGIYTACDGKVTHWIIVKAVCDFGDGTKDSDPNKDLYQEIAIKASVSLSHKVFSGKFSFDDIGIYSGAIKRDTDALPAAKKKIFGMS